MANFPIAKAIFSPLPIDANVLANAPSKTLTVPPTVRVYEK